MGPVRLVDHLGGQRLKIVGAQQPEPGASLESGVQEGLIQLAFGKLSRGALGMYRFPDPPQLRDPGMVLDDGPPGGDEPPRLAAGTGHVGEAHVLRLSPQLPAEHADLRTAHRDEDRVTGTDRPADNHVVPAKNSAMPQYSNASAHGEDSAGLNAPRIYKELHGCAGHPQKAMTHARPSGMLVARVTRARAARCKRVQPRTYEVTFAGQAGTTLRAEFDDCDISVGPGTITLRARLLDQGALYGLLQRIAGLGLELIEVRVVAPPPAK